MAYQKRKSEWNLKVSIASLAVVTIIFAVGVIWAGGALSNKVNETIPARIAEVEKDVEKLDYVPVALNGVKEQLKAMAVQMSIQMKILTKNIEDLSKNINHHMVTYPEE